MNDKSRRAVGSSIPTIMWTVAVDFYCHAWHPKLFKGALDQNRFPKRSLTAAGTESAGSIITFYSYKGDHPVNLPLPSVILSKSVIYILASARFRGVMNWTIGKDRFQLSRFLGGFLADGDGANSG